jgi:hypothetical protein
VIPRNATEIVKQWTDVHGLLIKPSFEELVDGYPRQVWVNDMGDELIESYSIPNMAHGAPLATGDAGQQCGAAGPFLLEVGISSSYHIAKFLTSPAIAPYRIEQSRRASMIALEKLPIDGAKANPRSEVFEEEVLGNDYRYEPSRSVNCCGDRRTPVRRGRCAPRALEYTGTKMCAARLTAARVVARVQSGIDYQDLPMRSSGSLRRGADEFAYVPARRSSVGIEVQRWRSMGKCPPGVSASAKSSEGPPRSRRRCFRPNRDPDTRRMRLLEGT